MRRACAGMAMKSRPVVAAGDKHTLEEDSGVEILDGASKVDGLIGLCGP